MILPDFDRGAGGGASGCSIARQISGECPVSALVRPWLAIQYRNLTSTGKASPAESCHEVFLTNIGRARAWEVAGRRRPNVAQSLNPLCKAFGVVAIFPSCINATTYLIRALALVMHTLGLGVGVLFASAILRRLAACCWPRIVGRRLLAVHFSPSTTDRLLLGRLPHPGRVLAMGSAQAMRKAQRRLASPIGLLGLPGWDY